MSDAAVGRWLADHLSGKAALLLAATNAQAAELARRARDELVALGLVATEGLIELADGNVAGIGDLIVARENSRIVAGETGRLLANRDVLRICAWVEVGEERIARVRRVTGRDARTGEVLWSAPFELSEEYLERHVDLVYAGNVHAAQGRTVDTAHLIADETVGRESLYVGMSRGRERNTVYVVTERVHVAELAAEPRPAPEIEDPAADEDVARRPSRFAVLADVLGRRQGDRTATAAMRDELEHAASLATLAPMWADVTRAHATRHYESTLRSLLAADAWQRFEEDPERGTLMRLLRAADLAGHDVDGVLRRAVQARDFGGARSIAGVLHGRVGRIVGTPDPSVGASYAERTPTIDDPVADQFARDLAAAMDARVSLLGRRVAADRPVWALRYLGELPADPVERADWVRRAGAIAAYREERGYAHEAEAIGPAPERGSPELWASWHGAYVALRLPNEGREVASASDGELWAWRAAYARETGWAPPYVVGDLREAHIAEDSYRAGAVLAWHRADAAADPAERARAAREAEELGALAQEVGAYREALTAIAEARRGWHAATEGPRQRALAADSELRRRHQGIELPPLRPSAEQASSARGPSAARDEADASQTELDSESVAERSGMVQRDIETALKAARRAQLILAERQHQLGREAGLDSDDVMRRREAGALREAAARASAVRQEPAAGRHAASFERDEAELEAGQ
jgi:hypothetical protein